MPLIVTLRPEENIQNEFHQKSKNSYQAEYTYYFLITLACGNGNDRHDWYQYFKLSLIRCI